MCDCYWPKCEKCDERLPLHIADFCMNREDISVFCARHIPKTNVVKYELIFEGGINSIDPPKGWCMGVRYLRRPPKLYGLKAAEPNTASSYLAEYRTQSNSYYFTERSMHRFRSEKAAVRAALQDIGQRRQKSVAGNASLLEWLEEERRNWEALKVGDELRTGLETIIEQLPILSKLRKSGNLVSLVLIGSLRNRDFIPELSDVDLWVLARRLKPGLKAEFVSVCGRDIEVNLICRNLKYFRLMLRRRNPVDLVAIRYGEIIFDQGMLQSIRNHAARYRASPATREAWMVSSARWLSRALEQYFSPDCVHCFFGSLYHGARDMLRAHIVGTGGDVTEGWEVESCLAAQFPELVRKYRQIRYARAHWQKFEFPLFAERIRIQGDLGELVLSLWHIARQVYKAYGLRLPKLQSFLNRLLERKAVKGINFFLVDPKEGRIMLGYNKEDGTLSYTKRKIPSTLAIQNQ